MTQTKMSNTSTASSPAQTLASITDGTSSTLAFGETALNRPSFGDTALVYSSLYRGRGWADPQHWSTFFTVNALGTPNSRLGGYLLSNYATATSYHPGGCNFSFFDGSVKFISENINGTTWAALGSVQGAEAITVP